MLIHRREMRNVTYFEMIILEQFRISYSIFVLQ